MRDFSNQIVELKRRVKEAYGYLEIDEAKKSVVDLNVQASDNSLGMIQKMQKK